MDLRTTALEVIAEISGKAVESLTPEMELIGDLGFDSASALELVMELEDRTGLQFNDDDIVRMSSVGQILRNLEALQPAP